jgi:AAA+ superfamily predicted ATPase
LPDDAARAEILETYLAGLPAPFDCVDISSLVLATEGLTAADLKRLVEDGKALYAFDYVSGAETKDITEYYLEAIHAMRTSMGKYLLAVSGKGD